MRAPSSMRRTRAVSKPFCIASSAVVCWERPPWWLAPPAPWARGSAPSKVVTCSAMLCAPGWTTMSTPGPAWVVGLGGIIGSFMTMALLLGWAS
eukprot:scaffold166068_cov35-Attheya_sp.AAC.1